MMILGVDGGGAKTAARLARVDSNGDVSVVGEGMAGPSNVRAVGIQSAIEKIRGSERTLVGRNYSTHAVVANRKVSRCRGVPDASPGVSRVVAARRRVGVLATDQLEGIDVLKC